MAFKQQPKHILTCAVLALLDTSTLNAGTIVPPPILKKDQQSQAIITTVSSVCDGLAHYPDLGPDDLVVCDLDETLVKHEKLSEEWLKKPFHEQITEWRFSLIDDRLPTVFKLLHEKNIPVVALTHTRTGSFESIPSMERWRFDIVNSLGLKFSFDEKKHTFQLTKMPKPYPSFFKGIILTAHQPKGHVLQAFLKKTKMTPKRILFFDDLKSNIDHVHKTLAGTTHLHCFHITNEAIATMPKDI